jgi:choline dehydrogenase-like flavoprotein
MVLFYPHPPPLLRTSTFHYIIVGGGTADATLAIRLAQGSQFVALIEAGTHYESSWALAAIPGALFHIQN